MSKKEFLKKYIRELVNEVEEELEESTATGAVDGYQTPHAFSAKKHTERRKKTATQAGYDIVDGDVENITESVNEDEIEGGLADDMTLQDIADKHNVSLDQIASEFKKGYKVEREHTTDTNLAKEIAMDHLAESPDYYTKLATIESVNEPLTEAGDNVSVAYRALTKIINKLKADWKRKGGYENFGQKELRKIKDKFNYNPYGSPEERQIAKIIDQFEEWAMNYMGESVNEGKAVLIGSALPYNDIPDLYYDESTKKFISPNYWNGKPVVVDPKRDIKWNKYKLTPLGEKLRKMYESVNEISDIKSGVTTMKELIRDLERELPKRMHNFYKGQDLKYFSFADEIALILKKYAISLEADELDTLSRALLTKLKPEIAKFKNLQPIVGNAKNVVAKYKLDEGRRPKGPVNRWLELKNDETQPNKKLAVGLKELKYKLSEIEKFLTWYNKISKMNELSSDSYWKRTHRHIYKIKERIINIAQTIKELEQ